MHKSIMILITIISARFCTAQIFSISPIIGGKMECARYSNEYEVPPNGLIESRPQIFQPMRGVLFGLVLNYQKNRHTWNTGFVLNEQVKTTISYQFPAIIDGKSQVYSNKLNIGEKLIKVPLMYRLTLLKNNGDYSNLSIATGVNFIFFYRQTKGIQTYGSLETFTLDNETTANNLSIQTYQYEIGGNKLNMSLELGLSYRFRLGEKQHLLTTLSYEQGLRFLTQTQTVFTYIDGSTLNTVNTSRGSSLHLKFSMPFNLNFSK